MIGNFRLLETLAIGHVIMASCCSTSAVLAIQGFCAITVLTDRISCWSGRRGMRPDQHLLYCKVLLLFDMELETDKSPQEFHYVYVSLFEQLKPREPEAAYKDLRLCGSPVVYEDTTEVIDADCVYPNLHSRNRFANKLCTTDICDSSAI